MSQPGSAEAATGSLDAKSSLPPSKMLSDDEAEEGEIFDEEEGEISESRQKDTAVAVAASSQLPASATADTASHPLEQTPSADLPASRLSGTEDKPLEDEKTLPTPAPSVDDVVQTSAQTLQSADAAEPAPESVQPPAESTSAAPTEPTAEETANSAPDTEASAEVADASADASLDQPRLSAQETQAPREPAHPSTTTLAEANTLNADEPVSLASTSQDHVMEDAPTAAVDVRSTEVQSDAETVKPAAVEADAKADGSADMDVDEGVVAEAPPTTEAAEVPLVAGSESMRVDSAALTSALPSEGPEAPAEPVVALAGEDRDEHGTSTQELASTPTQVKTEPQTEVQQQAQVESDVKEEAEPVQAAPLDNAPQSNDEQAQDKPAAANAADTLPEPLQERETPSATLVAESHASASDAPISGEVTPRATVERNARSASRPAEVDQAQSRTTNRSSAAPSSVPERRSERERTKDRSHAPERSQDREQRTREKDRRRELERLERERERERERIRESERDREMMIARENEEARLIWLSLPGNDHPQYYTDTDSDSCYGADGAFGLDLAEEEDKDLNPPLPLSLQEYHPAPSYSQSYFDDSHYSSKRKRTDDANDDGLPSSSRHARHRPIPTTFAGERPVPAHRDAPSSSAMINIDDFPIPDSDVRGEPSERPFASRVERASLPRISPYARSEDVEAYSASDSDEEALRLAEERQRRHGNRGGNRGNKLSREKGARWVRRGKLGGWTEMRMEKEIGDRVRHRVEAMQKDNVRALLSAMPDEDKAMLAEFPALRNGLIPSGAPSDARRDARGRLLPSDISEAARIDAELGLDGGSSGMKLEQPEHLTSTSLAPTLLKPAITPRQVLTSHTLRHTFRNPHIAALGKTALDLIESEGVVGRAVGRCWAAMERGGFNADPEPKADEAEEVELNGMDVDETHEDSALFGSPIDNPALSHLDKLFVTKQGLAIPRLDDSGQPIFVPPSPQTQAARAEAGVTEEAANEAVIETTLLPAPEQRSIVLAALECLHDLAADSREYVERLEEVRSRLAAVKRRRAQVWNAVRQWALDRDMEGAVVNEGQGAGVRSGGMVGALSTAVVNGNSPRKRK